MEQLQLVGLQHYPECQWHNVNYGSVKDMPKKRYHILAKCYDKKGRLLSAAFNSYTKSHPLQAWLAKQVGHESQIHLHAEIAAILRARGKPIHRIVTERFDKAGLPVNAEPCPICKLAIKMFGISKVEFTK